MPEDGLAIAFSAELGAVACASENRANAMVSLLLWRKRLAVGVYRVTLVAALVGTAYQSVLFARLGMTGQPVVLGTTTIIVVAAVGPFLYARTLPRRGMLH